MRRTSPVIALVVAVLLALSGCGGASGTKDAKKKEKTPAQIMAAAKKKFDSASSIHIKLKTDDQPSSGGNAVLSATGDVNHDPAFKGDVKVLLSGITATVPVTATGGKVYAKLPLTTGYSTINPDEYSAPDPARFADPDSGLSSLLTKIETLKKKGQTRTGDLILTTYSGTLPGQVVKTIIPSAAAGSSYDTTVGIDDKGYAKAVKITGPFFDDGKAVTYDVAFSDYDKGVKISAPKS